MSKNFLEIKNVSFRAGGKTKVRNVSFNIENKGDIICLLGPSGVGKTTILRTIAGLEKIKSGSIKLKDNILSSAKNCDCCCGGRYCYCCMHNGNKMVFLFFDNNCYSRFI